MIAKMEIKEKSTFFSVLCLTNPKAHEVKNQSQGLRLRSLEPPIHLEGRL